MLLNIVAAVVFSLQVAQAKANNFLTLQDFEKITSTKSLVFISSECPCSKSHIEHIKKVASQNPDVEVFAVTTESTTASKVEAYYQKLGLPVILDKKEILLNKYKALKTPHVTVISSNKIIYQGGVTNKKNPESATKFYFRDVLKATSLGEPLPYKNGRSLGCYIQRSKK